MAVAWPSTLPQRLIVDGATVGRAENRMRSEVDHGPAKVRRRGVLNIAPLAGTMEMSTAQLQVLHTFVDVTLQGGTAVFSLPDPLNDGQTLDVRFGEELPVASALGGGWWEVALDLEVLP